MLNYFEEKSSLMKSGKDVFLESKKIREVIRKEKMEKKKC